MLQFPTWKYVVAALVIALSVFYSLPNLYPQDPAVQIAANRGSAIHKTRDPVLPHPSLKKVP